jgi:Tol biopolymer transport system component
MNSKMSKKVCLLIVLALLAGMAGQAKADFVFGTPTNLGLLVNSTADDGSPSISADGLTLVFVSNRPGGHGEADLWMTTRATKSDPWEEPVNLGSPVNTPDPDWCMSLSHDGCTLYYASQRSGGEGGSDIWVSTRATTDDVWGEPVNLGTIINHSGHDGTPFISEDGLELYFTSLFRSGGYGGDDIWVSTRESNEDEWGTPMNLGPVVNSQFEEIFPVLSTDGLSLFFSSGLIGPGRPGGSGRSDIWVTRRKTRDADWGEPVNLGQPVNSSLGEWSPTFSADGSTLYFSAGVFGSGDLYEVSIDPVVDLNDDGIVDSADMVIMVDNWGTDEPLCDIGPMPWGDGIVDVQDLIVLAEHLFEEIPPVE